MRPPTQPPSSLEARKPGLGWEILLGPDQVFQQKREGSHPSWKDPLVWRQEGGPKAGHPEETPGKVRSPDWGLPAESEEQLRGQGQLRQGLRDCKTPVPQAPHKRAAWSPPRTQRTWPQEHQEVTGPAGPGQTLPLHWGEFGHGAL